MKIALIGFGTMGKLIEAMAIGDAHTIFCRFDDVAAGLAAAEMAAELKGADVAIDFSHAEAVKRNIEACVAAGVPVVEGTTGWNQQRDEIVRLVERRSGALVYGSNFSIGVNLFYRIVDRSAELFAKFTQYETFIEERHHSRKKDAPSGTALKLKEIVAKYAAAEFSVTATRAGDIPGTHTVGFDSSPDTIELIHTARSREGFARGALMAAEWIAGKSGIYEFSDVMDEILSGGQ
jgi:4-hydroxy-tetrahydrodipicolinate reductase